MRRRIQILGLGILVGLLTVVVLVSCEEAAADSSGGSGDVGASLVGSWSGTWEDTVYSVDGPMNMTVTETGEGFSGSGNLTLLSVEHSATVSGTVSGDTLNFTFESATIGSGSGTVVGNEVSGSGSASVLGYGPFTFSGTVDGNTITGSFDFTDATGGEGTVSVALQ